MAPRRSRGLVAVAVAVGVGGLVGGLTGGPEHGPPASAPVQATVQVQGIVLAEAPTAVLRVGLENVGVGEVIADRVTVSGGGLVTTSVVADLTLDQGPPRSLTVRAPISCSRGDDAGGTIGAEIALRAADGATPARTRSAARTLRAVPVGHEAAAPGGLCSAADAALPNGWLEVARTTSLTRRPDGSLRIEITGLPADAVDIVGAQADDVLIPLPDVPVPVRNGTATLDLDRPHPTCGTTRTRPVFPAGVQLLLHGSDLRFSYLPVGLGFSDWLADAIAGTCPDSPRTG